MNRRPRRATRLSPAERKAAELLLMRFLPTIGRLQMTIIAATREIDPELLILSRDTLHSWTSRNQCLDPRQMELVNNWVRAKQPNIVNGHCNNGMVGG